MNWNLLIHGQIPLWIKIAYSLFLCVLIPVYWKNWGLSNFLWISDVSLILTVFSLWFENRLLASTIACISLIPEIFWNVEFIFHLLTGKRIAGLTDYMFNREKPLYLRLLSLFHVFLPVVMFYLVYKLGYDKRALISAIILTSAVFMITYLFTDPKDNINQVFYFVRESEKKIPHGLYLFLIITGMTILFFLPTHFILSRWFS